MAVRVFRNGSDDGKLNRLLDFGRWIPSANDESPYDWLERNNQWGPGHTSDAGKNLCICAFSFFGVIMLIIK